MERLFTLKTIGALHDQAEMLFFALELPSMYVVRHEDAPFASNADISSQLGFIVLLNAKTIMPLIYTADGGSVNASPVLEVYSFSHCLDFVLVLAHDLSSMLGRKIYTVLFTDSKCPFDTITKLSTVAEKRFLIDIASIRETTETMTSLTSSMLHHDIIRYYDAARGYGF